MSAVARLEPSARRFRLLRLYCAASALTVVAVGLLVLVGWKLDSAILMSVLPGLVTMKANTALCLVLLGASVWLLLPGESRSGKTSAARVVALAAAGIGAASLSQYVFGADLHIDELLFLDPRGSIGTSAPGRMAPMTATAFVALGAALVVLDWRTRRGHRPSQVLSLWAALIALLAISGYIYHATVVYRLFLYTSVAVHTAVALCLLSAAVFFARPRDGIAGVLTGEGSGSVMARRFLPAVFGIPILFGWICLKGQRAGMYGTEPGLALYATSFIIVFAVLVWWSARQMNREFDQRSRAEVDLRELNAELEERVADRTRTLEDQAAALVEQAALLDLAQDAIVVQDMDGRIVFWNRGAETLFGWSREDAVGRVAHELLKTELPEPIPAIESRLLREGRWEGEATHRRRDGSGVTVASRWALQRDARGAAVRILAINNDITGRKEFESKLLLLNERLALATEVAKVGVWEWDVATGVLAWDATMFTIYGYPASGPVTYANWAAAVHPEDLPATEAALRRVVEEKGQGALEFRIVLPDGSVRHVAASERVVVDERGQVGRVIGVNMDVTERKQAERALRNSESQMAYSAQHDFLTGLPNRMLLNDRISQAIALARRHSTRLAVLFLDLDGFKHINDSLGHPVGDRLLQGVSKRLVGCVRHSDTVSRQGGDEFVVLLSEVEQVEDAAITARRMLHAVAAAHVVDGSELHVTTSIGVSVYPDDGKDAETLIKNADTAMYQAKENGRQGYKFFKPAMNIRAVERQTTEEGLRRALDRGEFTLDYQPRVDVQTGTITGAEALIRWMHPTGEPVPPAKFLPVAEDSGLIVPIGRWVLREACAQARAWMDAGRALSSIAVNVSAAEFQNEGFIEGVFSALEETSLHPSFLELELRESVLMKRIESAERILAALRNRGVRVTIDAFGTGYSSLSYLKRFLVDSIKLDPSIVRQISTDPGETGIVSAAISMGRSLNLRVIAVGVETSAELAFLQGRGCDEAQGFYFSRPIAPRRFAKLLEAGPLPVGDLAVVMA